MADPSRTSAGSPAPAPRGLRFGAWLLFALVVLAWGAPFVATDLPLLARDSQGWSSPALRDVLGLRPDAAAEPLLRAPIPYAPNRIDLGRVLSPPSASHWMGTDPLGRDLASRLVHGGRVSILVGLLATAFAMIVGLPLGALAGYVGSWTDASISRLIEAALCLPSLILILVLVAAAPGALATLPDVLRIAIVLGLTGWMPVARYLRGEFLKLRRSDMVASARAAGVGHWRIATRHILPCSLGPVLVTAAFSVGAAILLEAALSFLGLGVRPPVPTWGGMLQDAREHVDRSWWLALFPGLALFAAVLACNLIGDGVRDRLDPRGGGNR